MNNPAQNDDFFGQYNNSAPAGGQPKQGGGDFNFDFPLNQNQ
jgi:hypothetical protein